MANVYTTNIFSDTLTAGGLHLFITPDGFMTVIRDLSVLLQANGGGSCFFKLNLNGGTFWESACPPGGQLRDQYEGRIAIPPLVDVEFICESGGLLDLATVHCAVFELALP